MRTQAEKDTVLARLDLCQAKYPDETPAGESNPATFDDCRAMLKGDKTMAQIQEEFNSDMIGGNHLAWCMDLQRWMDGEIEADEYFGEAVIIGKPVSNN